MGKRIREKQSATPHGNGTHPTHPGRVWGILHVIKYHHWRHVKRRLTHKRHSGAGRNDPSYRDGIPESVDDSVHDMSAHYEPNTTLSNAEENQEHSTPPAKSSIKSRIKALIQDEMSRKMGRHKRSSTCPTKSQLVRANSIHHLEVDPLSELLLTAESPEPVLETFQNHHAAGTLEVLSPVFSKKPVTYNDKCVDCGTMISSDILEQNMDHKHHKQCTDTNNLSSPNEGDPEEKLINAKILTTDVSPHLFKDFLDALDIINTNKDYLLNYIQDPGSPLPFHSHNELKFSGKRRSNSISFPVSASSSGSKDSEPGQLINKMVDDWFDAKEDDRKASMFDFTEDHHPLSRSFSTSHKFDEYLNPDFATSVSSQAPNHVKTSHFKDLRKKLKHLIEENKNEKYRITMDAVLDKIPHGSNLSKNVKRLIHDKFKDPTINGEGKDSARSGFERSLSSNSFKKRQLSMRTSSLKESARRYSQLYETCFNTDIKYPKPEKLKFKAEEKNSILKTPKSFKRFLSLPNLKSYFHQSEEPSVPSSPQSSTRQFGEKFRSMSFNDQKRSFDHGDDLKSHVLRTTFVDNTIPESILNADQKNLLVRSASRSGLDVININEGKDDKSISIDGVGNLKDSDAAASAEQDTGPATESSAMKVDANSVFSSNTSFLDATFEFDKLNVTEDSELQPGPADEVDGDVAEQQEPEVDHTDVIESEDSFQKIGSLSKRFDYEIRYIEVEESHKAAFNYVKKVLELSGFTANESLGIWYSDNQPVDPSIYEELEGCLLLDPDCSGNCDEDGQCNHLLLFDIINEGLLEIFGRSYSYYPRPLSSLSHVHPLPTGDNVLHKVWTLISWYLNSPTSEVYLSLDYYVSRDLAKNDGWMNLQFDSECVGLELDDMIFDDLLDEIIFTLT